MLKYIRFVIWLIHKRFVFFRYPLRRQACVLERKKLYLEAGKLYTKLKIYNKALECFKLCHAHKQLMYTYEKLGLISEALQIADDHKYYKDGALICDRTGNKAKAAYFYSYFDAKKAAKIFKKERYFYQAGLCYLQDFEFAYAMDCFHKCSNLLHQLSGFKQVEEFAVVLYYHRRYKESFKLFIRLQDYYSALECAKKLHNQSLITHTHALIAETEAHQGNYAIASHFAKYRDPDQADTYDQLSLATEDLSA